MPTFALKSLFNRTWNWHACSKICPYIRLLYRLIWSGRGAGTYPRWQTRQITTPTSWVNAESQQPQHECFWMVGGSWSFHREPTHAWGEHANSTQKGPIQDLNQQPYCEIISMLPQHFFIQNNRQWSLFHCLMTLIPFGHVDKCSFYKLWHLADRYLKPKLWCHSGVFSREQSKWVSGRKALNYLVKFRRSHPSYSVDLVCWKLTLND